MSKDYIERAKELVNDFILKEFGEYYIEEDFKDIYKIPLMYTSYENNDLEELDIDSLEVQVYLDLIARRLWVEYNGKEVYCEVYGSQKDMLEQLESLDFDSWTNLDELDIYINKIYSGVE